MSEFTAVTVAVPATQVTYPWRAALRTALQFVLAFAAGWPLVVSAIGEVPPWLAPVFLVITAVAAAITRVMAIPLVNLWLAKIGLAAQPKAVTELAAKPLPVIDIDAYGPDAVDLPPAGGPGTGRHARRPQD